MKSYPSSTNEYVVDIVTIQRGGLRMHGSSREPGSDTERFEARWDVGGGVGVQGPAAAVVAGVQRGQQVDHLGAADLTDHQPVRG